MSDESKNDAKVQQHDEPGDEVEGHSKHDSKIERPGVTDDGDEVEAHKVEKVEGRSDEKMV